MNYGLDANIASPPFSCFIALMLIAGCDAVGVRGARLFGLLGASAPAWHRWQSPIFGVMFLSTVLYPLALAGLTPRGLLQVIAAGLTILGILHVVIAIWEFAILDVDTRRHVFHRLISLRGWYLLLVLLLISMGLIALGPVTNSDSLNYHVGVALAILTTGTFPFAPEWFAGRLAGNGEVLNALGLSIGAEQFGSLIQFSGLVGIVGLFIGGEDAKGNCQQGLYNRSVLAVTAASAPVLLALVSSSKPQLLQVAMTTLALALIVFPSRRDQASRPALMGFALICLLVMTASQAKFSFLLGGGLVGLLAFAIMVRQRLFLPAFCIGILASLIVLAPPLLWKHSHFGGSLVEAFINPFPGSWPGSIGVLAILRGYRDNPVPFPMSLFIPSGIGTISTIIGGGSTLLLCLRPGRDPWAWTLISAALIATVLGTILGQVTSRFYLEPYYWLLMALLIAPVGFTTYRRFYWTKWVVAGQAVLTMSCGFYGAATLLPGAIATVWRDGVMDSHANGYSLMKWADSVLPAEAVLLSSSTSLALAPREVVSMDWADYVSFETAESFPYLARLKERGVTHMLLFGKVGDRESTYPGNSGPLKRCLGSSIIGAGFGRQTARNPFNIGEWYPAWIVEFNVHSLPDCALPQPTNP